MNSASRAALVISGISEASHAYRAEQLAKSLISLGWTVRVFGPGQTEDAFNMLLATPECSLVVLVRSPLVGQYQDIVATARQRDIRVLADFDDLIFRMDIFHDDVIDGLRLIDEQARHAYAATVPLYLASLQEADGCILSTRHLATQAVIAGARRTWVVPNVHTYAQGALSAALHRRLQSMDRQPTTIGYASGSMTHQRDFAEAAEGIASALESQSSARLQAVGCIDLSEHAPLSRVSDRVSTGPLRTLGEIPLIYHEFDIAIAPLQLGNPFTDSKSVLKFIDATLVGIPTVASPSASFAELRAGNEVLLATSSDDWSASIRALLTNRELRQHLVEQAQSRVAREFSPEAHVRAVGQMLVELDLGQPSASSGTALAAQFAAPQRIKPVVQTSSTGLNQVVTTKERAPQLLWWIPAPEEASGGVTSVFRMASQLARCGITSAVAMSGHDDREITQGYATRFGVDLWPPDLMVPTASRQVATHWPTAWDVTAGPQARRPLYFIQDFEPAFYPMSYDYLRALRTYALPLHHVYYGPWVSSRVSVPTGSKSITIAFPLDEQYRIQADGVREPLAVAFLARPDMARRCYDFTVQLLRSLIEVCPEITVHAYGSADLPGLEGLEQVQHAGYRTDAELSLLYRQCALGISLSTTNPSAVPYELMSQGCIPVDLATDVAELTYRDARDVPLLIDLDVAAARDLILDALADERGLAMRRERAFAATQLRPTPTQTAELLAAFIGGLDD